MFRLFPGRNRQRFFPDLSLALSFTQVSMSKFVLQTFHVTDTFLQGVRQKASIYPEDINLAKVREPLLSREQYHRGPSR